MSKLVGSKHYTNLGTKCLLSIESSSNFFFFKYKVFLIYTGRGENVLSILSKIVGTFDRGENLFFENTKYFEYDCWYF